MIELNYNEMHQIRHLFQNMEDATIYSCLDGYMGRGFTDDAKNPKAAFVYLGAFLFVTGENLTMEHVAFIDEIMKMTKNYRLIVVSDYTGCASLLEEHYKENFRKINRYRLIRNEFDKGKLNEMIGQLPGEYKIHSIDHDWYDRVLEEKWCRDFVSNFNTKEDFINQGIGYIITYGDKIISGASSYSVYKEGIDIQITTHEDFRNKGLAQIIGAKIIVECLDKGILPNWDAANLTSARLAERLGYTYAGPYDAYYIVLNA